MTMFFYRIIEFSVYGTIWLLLYFLITTLTRKQNGTRWQYFVTICIAVHLLIPVHIQWISLDIPFLQTVEQRIAGKTDTIEQQPIEPSNQKTQTSAEKQNSRTLLHNPANKPTMADSLTDTGSVTIPTVENTKDDTKKTATTKLNSLLTIAEIIWLLGMFLFFGRIGISYLVFCKQAKRWSLPADNVAHQILQQVQHQYGICRKIRLQRNNKINSPMLYGIIKPSILLPDEKYSPQEYQYIFRHELSHYRHGDIGIKYLFTICRGVYWFHPLVQRMCRQADTQMELLCDESVISEQNTEEKQAYCMIILRHMSNHLSIVPLTTNFYGGKKYMKKRFQNIMNTSKRKTGLATIVIAAMLALILMGVKWSALPVSANQNGKTETAKIPAEKIKLRDRTIAIIGVDQQEYADAILLVHVDAAAKQISVENIPRDLLVDFKTLEASLPIEQNDNQTEKEKLYKCHLSYGYGTLVGAMERLFDINIDSHIVLDYATVYKLIDTVGGVEITVTKKEADYLNQSNYIANKKNRTISAGKQRLNGEQAVGYMRIRSTEAGGAMVNGKKSTQVDIFGRAERCNNVLFGLLEQVQQKKPDWTDLFSLLIQGKQIEETDIPKGELLALAGGVVSQDINVALSTERTADDYITEYDSKLGPYLRLEESRNTK